MNYYILKITISIFLANNGPINPSNPSKISQILNLINYNDTKFNNLRLEYETNIIDFMKKL